MDPTMDAFTALRAETERERSAMIQRILLSTRPTTGSPEAAAAVQNAPIIASTANVTPSMLSPNVQRALLRRSSSDSSMHSGPTTPRRLVPPPPPPLPPQQQESESASPPNARRKQSMVKAAQVFGDASLLEQMPKSFRNSHNYNEDLKAKLEADRQFVKEREQARQARLSQILQAQPTTEQLSLPEAQRQSKRVPHKALAMLGSETLEKQVRENTESLPFQRRKSTNNKAVRVLGSVSHLGQPKLERMFGKDASDEEDARARSLARQSWDKEVKQRLRRSSKDGGQRGSLVVQEGNLFGRRWGPDASTTEETKDEEPMNFGTVNRRALELIGMGNRKSQPQDQDRRVDEAAGLVSLLDRFAVNANGGKSGSSRSLVDG